MAKDANATKEMRALFFDKGFKLPEVTKDAVQALVEARGLIGNSLCGEGGSNHLEQLWCQLIVAKPKKGGCQPSFMLPFLKTACPERWTVLEVRIPQCRTVSQICFLCLDATDAPSLNFDMTLVRRQGFGH